MSNRRRPGLMNLYRSEYLTSRDWFARRDRWFTEEAARGGVLACAACGQPAEKTQLELHHLDYAGLTVKEGRWLAFERHEDLLPLHRTCHDLLHRLIDRDEVLAYHRTRRDATRIALERLAPNLQAPTPERSTP